MRLSWWASFSSTEVLVPGLKRTVPTWFISRLRYWPWASAVYWPEVS